MHHDELEMVVFHCAGRAGRLHRRVVSEQLRDLWRGPITITIQIIAALLMVWARLTFGIRSFHGTANPTAGGLVTTGPYRYIRHPIYAAILYFFWAGIAAHPSRVTVAVGLLATALTAV